MKVILTRDVPKVGHDGEILNVANGYARNYLFPRQLAVLAKGDALKRHSTRIARDQQKAADQRAEAQLSGEKVRDQHLTLVGKANPKSNRLFGSITEADVAEALTKATGVAIDKRRVSLIDPIKTTGNYSLTVRLHPDVVVPFTIEVATQELLDARERARVVAEEKATALAAAEAAAAAPPVEAVAAPPVEVVAVEETEAVEA